MIKFQKVQLDDATVSIDFEGATVTVNGVEIKADEAAIAALNQLVSGGEPVQAPTKLDGRSKEARAARASTAPKAKSAGSTSKGDATANEVRKALEAVGKKGMTLAELRSACGGKRTAAASEKVGVEFFGDGKGAARKLRLQAA